MDTVRLGCVFEHYGRERAVDRVLEHASVSSEDGKRRRVLRNVYCLLSTPTKVWYTHICTGLNANTGDSRRAVVIRPLGDTNAAVPLGLGQVGRLDNDTRSAGELGDEDRRSEPVCVPQTWCAAGTLCGPTLRHATLVGIIMRKPPVHAFQRTL